MSFIRNGVRFHDLQDVNDQQHINHKGPASPSHHLVGYFHSKLANALFAKSLQKKPDVDGIPIIAIAADPGAVNTEGSQQDPTTIIGMLFQTYFVSTLCGRVLVGICCRSALRACAIGAI